jgi:hypothetical protein
VVDGSRLASVAVADLDADGVPEIVAIETGGYPTYPAAVAIYHLVADELVPLDRFAVADGADKVAIADLDGDGHLDLAIAGGLAFDGLAPAGLRVWLGRGARTFIAGPVLHARQRTELQGIRDVLGTGRPQLVVSTSAAIELYELAGDGLQRVAQIPTGSLPHPLAIADLDGDGRLDLMFARGDSVVAMTNAGHGAFRVLHRWPCQRPLSIGIADLDGDGQADGLVACGGLEQPGEPNTWIVAPELLSISHVAAAGAHPSVIADSVTDLAIGDVTGDGANDAVALDGRADTLAVYRGGAAKLTRLGPVPASEGLHDPAIVALASNGRPDVLAVPWSNSHVLSEPERGTLEVWHGVACAGGVP